MSTSRARAAPSTRGHVGRTVDRPPHFVVIGAMKSGTTSLYQYLNAHPDVCMARMKEPDYFIEHNNGSKGPNWYLSLFMDASRVCGEASPNYTKRHVFPGVPERLHSVAPNAKLIYVVRDPIARVVSHYVHNYAHGREGRTLSEAIRKPDNSYILTSAYFYQIQSFREHFPDRNIMMIDADDLRARTRKVTRSVFRLIGVEPSFESDAFTTRYHTSGRKLRRSCVDRYIKQHRVRRLLKSVLPRHMTRPQPFERPTLNRADRAHLEEHLAADIRQLRMWSRMAFEQWSL